MGINREVWLLVGFTILNASTNTASRNILSWEGTWTGTNNLIYKGKDSLEEWKEMLNPCIAHDFEFFFLKELKESHYCNYSKEVGNMW